MIKVLIVDDHKLLRNGIREFLNEISDIEIVGEAESGEDALTLAREVHPDVVLMDVRMPGIGGLEAARRLLRHQPGVKIIALTSCKEEPFPSRFLQIGAHGYLTKGCDFDEMNLAIHKVYNNEKYLSPEIAQDLALDKLSSKSKKKSTPFDELSERELQVMLMIASGHKVQDISDKLCLSPKTVNSYRYRLFEKLRVSNDVEIAHLAIRHNMLGDEICSNDTDFISDESE